MKLNDICLWIISFIPSDSVESVNKYTTKYQLDPYITRGLRTEPPEASSFPRGPTRSLAEYPVKVTKVVHILYMYNNQYLKHFTIS